MTIEIVFADSFENVRDAVHAAFGAAGFKVSAPPLAAGVQVKAKLEFVLGERGSKPLSTILPFFFKVESLAATVAAYQDGTTALTLRESGTYGGNLANGAVTAISGGGGLAFSIGTSAGSLVAQAADRASKHRALSLQLAKVEALLRERLAGKIAYEGPVKPGVAQVPA